MYNSNLRRRVAVQRLAFACGGSTALSARKPNNGPIQEKWKEKSDPVANSKASLTRPSCFTIFESKSTRAAKLALLNAVEQYLNGEPLIGRFEGASFDYVLNSYIGLLPALYNNSPERAAARAFDMLLIDLRDSKSSIMPRADVSLEPPFMKK